MAKKKHSFKVGDRVVVCNTGQPAIDGKEAIIAYVSSTINELGIRIPGWKGGHTLAGRIRNHSGWWVTGKHVTPGKLTPFQKSLRKYIEKELG